MDPQKDEEGGRSDEKLSVANSPNKSVDLKSARFPFCLVWTPLPVISWLAPYIGHVGICRANGVILDFAGSYFINVDNFAFGNTYRYLRLDTDWCCFPPNLSGHTCKNGFAHAQCGTAMSWDDGIRMSMQSFQHMSYNLFTCNCHSFVANCLNRLAYKGSVGWNVLKVIGLIHLKGQWVSSSAAIKSFVPFGAVMFIGVMMAGWPFVIGWATFSFLLFAWFIVGTYIFKGLIEC
ncbi:hypothetical protein O6H91_06G022700 [Diphasiastrum complanatum]|uniref:Uncharacterized protein n=1 Tax=Diphasiastrum complanatum TaxID=34168 RepID=A0ACC2DBH1_DIPCM|nr:hypothetical protein O6H91_06G022700 [Diphasiastrum complanatum]